MSFLDEDQPITATRNRAEDLDLALDVAELPAVRNDDTAELAGLSRLAQQAGPRDIEKLKHEARAIGYELGQILDERGEGTAAFYRWTAGGSVIEGPTVDLMDALGHVYGRLVYSVRIVQERGPRVTLRGKVVDLVNLVAHERDYSAFLRAAPGKFANKADEAERWRVMQLQAAESKAIRGVLEHVVPRYLVDAALTAAKDGAARARLRGASLPDAIGKTVEALRSARPPIDLAVVERWVGRPPEQWTAVDLGELRGLYKRWKDGLLTPDGLRAETHDREQSRSAPDEQPVSAAPSGDRLASLGLGSSGPLGESTEGGSGKSQGAAPAPVAQPEPQRRQPSIGEDLDALIRGLEKAGGPVTVDQARERYKAEAGVQRLTPQRWDPIVALGVQMGKIRVDGNLVSLVRQAEPAREPDSVDRIPDHELADECRSLAADLSADAVDDAMRKAGLSQIDGAIPAALRVLLRELLAYVPDAGGAS